MMNADDKLQWNATDDVIIGILKNLRIPKSAMFTRTLITPECVKSLRWTTRDGTQHKISDKQFNRIVENFTTVPYPVEIIADSERYPTPCADRPDPSQSFNTPIITPNIVKSHFKNINELPDFLNQKQEN